MVSRRRADVSRLRRLFALASVAALAAAIFHGASMFLPEVSRLEYTPGYPS